MQRNPVVEHFLNNRTLEGAPGVEPLRSLDELGEGSVVYHPDVVRGELVSIEVEKFINLLTRYDFVKGRFHSENKHSKFFTTFPKDPLTMPRRYLKISQDQIEQGEVYHTKPF